MPSRRRTIRTLFSKGPPTTPEEVKRIVTRLDQRIAREEFLSLIRDDALAQAHFGLFSEIASLLDLPRHCAEQLADLANDKKLSALARQFAVLALTSGRPTERIRRLLEQMEPDLLSATADMPLIAMMTTVQLEPDTAVDVTEMLLSAPFEAREFVLSQIGRIRREVGTPAALAYAHALSNESLAPLFPHMLEALVEEGGTEGKTLLESLRDKASDDRTRRLFQMALLRTGTKHIDSTPSTFGDDCRIFVSNCDGQGAFFLLGRFRVSKTSTTTASCCIRASQEIRDAFVFPAQSDEEFEELFSGMQNNAQVVLTEAPPDHGALLFEEGLARTKALGCDLPASARPVLDLYERMSPSTIKEPEIRREICLEALETLLGRQYYESWFFDEGDIVGNGIRRYRSGSKKRWKERAATKLASSPVKERLLAMLRHMSRWHRWNNEDETADLLIAAANEVKRNFETSAIVELMLDQSLRVLDGGRTVFSEDDLIDRDWLGDSSLRALLRRTFFSHLKRPQGRHVAELDFTEVAYRYLSEGFAFMPAEKRPNEDLLLALAYNTAKSFVYLIINDFDLTGVLSHLKKQINKHTSLSKVDINNLIGRVTSGMFQFVNYQCLMCPLRCFDNPRQGMADAFFADSSVRLD